MWNKLFDMENSFWTFANKVADMVILEIIWLITSIPLVTVGAATSAFWHVMIRLAEDREGHIIPDYFRAFGKCLKTGTAVWLIQLASGLFLLFDIYICVKMNTLTGVFLVGVFGVFLLILVIFSTWLYPLAGVRGFSCGKVLGNSAYLTLRHFPHTVSCAVLFAASLVLSWYVRYAFIVAPVLACYGEAKVMAWILSRYEEENGEDSQGE